MRSQSTRLAKSTSSCSRSMVDTVLMAFPSGEDWVPSAWLTVLVWVAELLKIQLNFRLVLACLLIFSLLSYWKKRYQHRRTLWAPLENEGGEKNNLSSLSPWPPPKRPKAYSSQSKIRREWRSKARNLRIKTIIWYMYNVNEIMYIYIYTYTFRMAQSIRQ